MLPADDVASVIIARHGTWIDAMSLQKLLYYTQAWHLAITNEPLFEEPVKAYRDGPVVPQVRHSRRDRATRRPGGQDLTGIPLDDFTDGLIDLVMLTYGSMSAEELSALTHTETPWIEARGSLPSDATCNNPISLDTMARFYRSRRKLGGYTAADLAAGGIPVLHSSNEEPVDVDSILDSLGDLGMESEEDPWGGGNLQDARQHTEGTGH